MENNFLHLAKERYSVRKFSHMAVEDEKIDLILEAARVAPTACNKQPIKIKVIKSEEELVILRKCTVCHFGETLAFLICYNKLEEYHREYDQKGSGDIDASIITTHMMLEAFDLGIGSTWVMHFIPEAVIEEFALPTNLEPVAILMMGYPSSDAKPYPGHINKKKIEDLLF